MLGFEEVAATNGRGEEAERIVKTFAATTN